MGSNAIFFAWNRSIPGRERMSADHFQEFVQYLTGLQQKGAIQSFETVFLNQHGGDLNGFFLIRGETGKLDGLVSTKEWALHMMRAAIHLEGSGAVRGVTGDLVTERMNLWKSAIPAG
ncbi:MAG: hypothetical protein AB1898_14240 [Acidobacteriota bacterium]